jgi:hypothetical protein
MLNYEGGPSAHHIVMYLFIYLAWKSGGDHIVQLWIARDDLVVIESPNEPRKNKRFGLMFYV